MSRKISVKQRLAILGMVLATLAALTGNRFIELLSNSINYSSLN